MKVLGVFLLLLFSQVGFAGQQYLGTQAKKIILAGAEFESDLTIVPIHSGDTVTTENVRASIQALYDTGHYEYIEVDADSSSDGTVLTFRVRPYHFFSTFRIEPKNLLSTPLSTYVRLPVGEKFSQTQVDRIAKQTEELFESEGYFKAVVTPEVRFDESTDLTTVTLNATVKARARISTIEFLGDTKTIPEKDLRDELGLKAGSEFSAEKLDSGVAKIRSKFTALGFLNGHVESDRNYNESTNTVSLTVHVEPGPSVHVEVLGYDIPDKKLREIVPVFEEGAVDPDLVDEGRAAIRQLLQQNGYYDAAVEAMIIHAPDNAVQIRYTVSKGDRYRIEAIHIEGNQFFTTEAIHTRLKSRTDVFSPDILNQDLETIRSMYKTAGFDGTAVESTISETDHAMDIVISIKEGRRYTMDSIAFVGNHDVTEVELRNKAALKPEQFYTPSAIEQARTALTSLYYAKGYPDAHVEQDVVRSSNQTGIELTFRIDEGQSYKIGRVLVAGNTRTKEKVIHRNSRLNPGSPYDPEVILQTQQKLYATGLFNRVDIVTLPQGLQGIRNILIQVEDASPLTVIYGVGYQDIDGPRATVEVSHNNLFGLDRPVTVRVVESKNDQLFRSTLRDPQLFNHDIEGDLSAYIEHTIQPQFNADRVDFSATALKRVSPHFNLLFTAGFQKINLLDILLNPLADAFPDETGIVHIARIGSTFVYDKRNDPINPRTGMFQTATVQLADRAFGSEFNFTSFFDQYIRYKPAGPGVIAFSLRFGWKHPFGGTTDLPITERYFAGGSTTLRGFGLYEAGPIGGGDAMTIGNLEYRFPLPLFHLKSLGGAVFYDTGNVFTSLSAFRLGDFTHSVGFGLRYQTPLGPVRTDVGFDLHPTVRSDGSIPKVFHAFFTLGHTF